MRRVVVIGPGASGKSTLAAWLGEITGLPVVELDKIFWRDGLDGLVAKSRDEWVEIQRELVAREWILDGDLGPYDAIEIRLAAADAIVFLDFSVWKCAWRAIRRARASTDFWMWLLRYRRVSRPFLMNAIREHAGGANVYVLRDAGAVQRFLDEAGTNRTGAK
jgi:adenylate kinase family enzyme